MTLINEYMKRKLITTLIVGTIFIIGKYIYDELTFNTAMETTQIKLYEKDSTKTIEKMINRNGCYEVGLSSDENIFSNLKLDGEYKIEYFDKNDNLLKEVITNKGTGITAVYSHTDYSNTSLDIFQVPLKNSSKLKIKLTVLKPESTFVKNPNIDTYMYINPSFMGCRDTEMSRLKKMNLIEMDEKQEKIEYEEIVEAIKNKDLKKIKEIIPSKYSVDEKMLVDRTPIEYAIYYKADEIIKYLVQNNATLDYIDRQRKTPLYYAIKNNSIEVVDMLLQRGVDPNNTRFVNRHDYAATFTDPTEEDLKGDPALWDSVCNEKYEITELLLKSPKVDVNEYYYARNIYQHSKSCLSDKYKKDYTDDFEIDDYGTKMYKNIPQSMERTIKLLERYGAKYEFPQEREGYIEHRKKDNK